MAEAAVGSVVQRLGNLIVQEAINLYGVSDQVKWLERELGRMQCFLQDADAKKNKGGIAGEMVKNWVREMRDIAFEAEDIIDTYMDLKLRRQERDDCICFMKRFAFIFDELVSRYNVYVDVKGIKARLQELSQSRISFGIVDIGETNGTSQDWIPILPQLSDDIDMVGFDDEKKKVVRELVDISNKDRSVISIVGMGGLGKTTLAKSVYNDPKVKRSFAKFAWVTVSQEYTILEILKRISLEVSAISARDLIPDLAGVISEKLKDSKYLIVLDDVWNENVWDQLQKVFPNVKNGSRVIITTRIKNVAKIADPNTKPHELRLLGEHESCELFLRKAFPSQDIETCCPEGLVAYVHQLVQRCGGLPLALVVLGGLVSTKPKTKEAWQKIVESMEGQFVAGGEKCLDILALSYNDLPDYLKSCFLYFGSFPEDMDVRAITLIRLWSAEGFLPTTEELGMNCLEELAQRCMIQITKRSFDDWASSCRIHDLLRDMCISKAKENRYLQIYKHDNAYSTTMSNVAARRLTIFGKIDTLNYPSSKLRALFCHHAFDPCNALNGGFKFLRVLYFKNQNIIELPSGIKSLIHLRHFELHANHLKEVPSWIDHLCNLQTFIVGSRKLNKISDSLWWIDSLKDVVIKHCSFSSPPPPNMGNHIVLKNLQTLKGVIAGEWIGNMLPELTNLRKLSIKDVSVDHFNALSSSLQKLGRLASLSLRGFEIPSNNIITAFSNQRCLKKLFLWGGFNCRPLPCNDVFPQQLAKLVLVLSKLEQDPMTTLEKLQFLKYLTLGNQSYRGKQMICSATGFPQLLSLTIDYCIELEEWKIEERAMPCLKYLCLSYCPKLKMIPEGLKNVPLDQLVLCSLPEELKTRVQENTGEDWYKIQHVPNISITRYH